MRLLTFSCVFFVIVILGEAAQVNISLGNGPKRYFPENFLFGAATSAYQVEGAWNLDGKGPGIWDEYVHSRPDKILDRRNADVGANSYEYYLDDIKALKSLNMNFYRFSISWARVLPTGDITQVNEKGIEYYNKVIDMLIEYGIKPMVTMFHFDFPQNLQLLGGFTNSAIVNYFEEYANLLYNRFGNRVKYWQTMNEPGCWCSLSYGAETLAPGINFHGIGEYLCLHNALKSHAVAYHLYKEKYYNQFKGKVGISLLSNFYYSDTNNAVLVDRAMQFSSGWVAHPIFSSEGDYPKIMISQIANNSKEEGRLRSRLPKFSKYWIEKIRGSSDFFGLNYYTSRYVRHPIQPIGENPSYERDGMFETFAKPEWVKSSSWIYAVPKGLGDILRWIKSEYNNPEVIITENGCADNGGLEDDGRIAYFHDHLEQVLEVILNDDCNVKGYTSWSLIDNFEWNEGYTYKFGLFSVQMTSPTKERIPKKSSQFMKTLIESRTIPDIP